jgi:rfaE bifunctional protein kinase chain/domain
VLRPRSVSMMRASDGGSEMATLLEKFAVASILVIGDVMLDEYVWGDVQRISPEAPVPVVELANRTYVAGGAANAAANVAALGGRASLGAVVGPDAEADILRNELTKGHIDANLVTAEIRPTTTKTRVLGGSQQILRIDRETRDDIARETESALLEWAKRQLPSVDCLLVSDYGKGVLTRGLCRGLVDLASAEAKPVVVDPKGRDYSKYRGATVVTPNVTEVRLAIEPLSLSSGDLIEDVSQLRSLLPGSAFAVTRGPEGVILFQADGSVVTIGARARHVFDVTGAGDTFVAALALAIAVGATLEEAATLSNTAAGLAVGKVGTGIVDQTELASELSAD